MKENQEIEELIAYLDREFYEFQNCFLFLKNLEKSNSTPGLIRLRIRKLLHKIKGLFGLERIELKEYNAFKHFKEKYQLAIHNSEGYLTDRLIKQADIFNQFLVNISSRRGVLEKELNNLLTNPEDKKCLLKVIKLIEETTKKIIGFRDVMKKIEIEEDKRFREFDWQNADPKKLISFFESLEPKKEKLALVQIRNRKDAHFQNRFSDKVIRLGYGEYIMPKEFASKYVIGFHTTCETIVQRIIKHGFNSKNGVIYFHPIRLITKMNMEGRTYFYGKKGCELIIANLMKALFYSPKRKIIERDSMALKEEIFRLLKTMKISEDLFYIGIRSSIPEDFISLPGLRGQTVEAIVPIKKLMGDYSTTKIINGKPQGYELHLRGKLSRKNVLYLHKPFNVFDKNILRRAGLLLKSSQEILRAVKDYKQLDYELLKTLEYSN